MPQKEFDKCGAGYDPGAPVWRTYVREADAFDAELVRLWNRWVVPDQYCFYGFTNCCCLQT